MLYECTAQEIVNKIVQLKPGPINKLFKQNDQMLLTWNKSQLFSKWPKCIIPGSSKNIEANLHFTGMISNIKQKAYDYNSTLKPVEQRFNQQEKLKMELQNQIIRQESKEFQVQIQVGDNQQKIEKNQNQQENQHQNQQLQQKSMIKSIKTSLIASNQHFSPFLPNYDNPFDRNANTKILKQKFDKIKLDSGKRNIAALIQTQKKTKQTSDNFKYGKSLPKKATDSIDITDILKYTLGQKRQKQLGQKPQPIKNPFVRVPQKYSEPLGDFYNGFKK